MSRNLLFLLRMTTLLATATANLFVADPRGFADKLAERIRLANGIASRLPTGWLRRFAAGGNTNARALINAGDLTAGIRRVAEQGQAASASDIHLAKRTIERIEQLEILPSTTREQTLQIPEDTQHRVLHVLTNSKPFTNSGYTVRSHHVLTCQQEVGIKVEAVTRVGYPVLVGKIPSSPHQIIDGITYHRLLPPRYPPALTARDAIAVRMIVDRAKAMEATILHTTTDYTNALVVAEAAKQLRVPWVYEVRGELESTWLSRQPADQQAKAELSEFYRLARDQETRCMRAADAVVALSEISKQQLVERGVPQKKISVIPNAVDVGEIGREFDQTVVRNELGLDEDVVLVGAVTAVVDYEGLDTLIESLQYLPAKYKVLVVGDGTERLNLEELAKNLGVVDRVRFTGRQPSKDIWRWYAALDVFVVPRKDTKVTRIVTPIKPLTAMALGIPVVMSDLPALREVTGDRAEYVIPENPRVLARAMARLVGQHQKGIDWVQSRTWSEIGTKYRNLYREITA